MPVDPTQTKVVQELTHESPWISCRFHPSGNYLLAGAEDFHVWRFELQSGAKTALPTDAWVRALAFAGDDLLITGGYDGQLIWWPVQDPSPQPLRKIEAHDGWIRAAKVTPDGQFLVTCGNDGLVKIWTLSDGKLVRQLAGHQRHVYNVAIHPDGQLLVSGDLTAQFIHWDMATGQQVRQFQVTTLHKYDASFLADYGGPYELTFSDDGAVLGACGITNVTNAFAAVGNPALSIVDWQTAAEQVVHLAKGDIKGKAWGHVLHPDGFDIAAVGGPSGGHLYFWKRDAKEEFHAVNLGNTARDLALHPDGLRLATAHHDKKLRISAMGGQSA